MKLSEKGIQKVLDDVFLICDEETGYIVKHWMPTEDFEPDDFEPEPKKEPTVELTLDEAKILETFCWGCASLLSTEEDAVYDKLVKRIKQAESK